MNKAEILENLRKGYLADLPSRIDKIENEVMSIESNESYDELFREVHSLKGSAGTHGFHIVTKIAHHMEDEMMSLIQKKKFKSSSTVDRLLKFIDLLRDTITALSQDESPDKEIEEQLEALRSNLFDKELNILVVEPSKVYASLIEYSMEDLPVKFTFIDDGLQALENLLMNKYHLLITSMECSRLRGDALVAALRLANNFNSKAKVILITSRTKDEIANNEDFDLIVDRNVVQDGSLNKIVSEMIEEVIILDVITTLFYLHIAYLSL